MLTVYDLAQRFNVSPRTIHSYAWRGIIPPAIGAGRAARYDRRHVEAIIAFQALKHNNATTREVVALCKELGISLSTYVKQREAAIREFGIGVA